MNINQPLDVNWDTPFNEMEIKDQESIKSWVKELLKGDQPVTVEFKKADGTKRLLTGTLNEAVGAKYSMNESTNKPKKKANPDICVVYDLEKDAWRSFRWDRLTNVQFNLG